MKSAWNRALLSLLVAALTPTGVAAADSPPEIVRPTSAVDVARIATTPGSAIRQAFARFDRNGDGWLTPAEWGVFVLEPANMPRDLDGDGRTSLTEFLGSFQTVRQPKTLTAEDVAHPLWMARSFWNNGDVIAAELEYGRTGVISPDCGEAFLGQGRCLERRGYPDLAERAYLRSLVEEPSNPETWLNLAMLHAAQGRPAASDLEHALLLYEQMAHLAPVALDPRVEDRYMRHVLESVRAKMVRLPGGAPLARRVAAWLAMRVPPAASTSSWPGWPGQRGLALAKQGWYREASEALETAARGRPDDWSLALLRAALENLLGRPMLALRRLDEARASGAPGGLTDCLLMGLLLDTGRMRDGLELSEKLRRSETSPFVLLEAGWQLAWRGFWNEALPFLGAAERTRQAVQRSAALQAIALSRLGQFPASEKAFEKLSEPASEEPPLLAALAMAADRAGLHVRATRTFAEALWQEPRRASVWLAAARLESGPSRVKEAEFALRTGLQLASIGSPGWAPLAVANLGPYGRSFSRFDAWEPLLAPFRQTIIARRAGWEDRLCEMKMECALFAVGLGRNMAGVLLIPLWGFLEGLQALRQEAEAAQALLLGQARDLLATTLDETRQWLAVAGWNRGRWLLAEGCRLAVDNAQALLVKWGADMSPWLEGDGDWPGREPVGFPDPVAGLVDQALRQFRDAGTRLPAYSSGNLQIRAPVPAGRAPR